MKRIIVLLSIVLFSFQSFSNEPATNNIVFPVDCSRDVSIQLCKELNCNGYLADEKICREYTKTTNIPFTADIKNSSTLIPIPKFLNFRAATCNNSIHFFSGDYNVDSHTLLSEGNGIIRAPKKTGTAYSSHVYCPVNIPDSS